MMNGAAQRLGAADSHFEDRNGLTNVAHHTQPRTSPY
jgi:D-alanyl-D-alanine carboxypeptidase